MRASGDLAAKLALNKIMINEFNSKGPVNYEDWIDLGRVIIPCVKGLPIVKDWSNPNFFRRK